MLISVNHLFYAFIEPNLETILFVSSLTFTTPICFYIAGSLARFGVKKNREENDSPIGYAVVCITLYTIGICSFSCLVLVLLAFSNVLGTSLALIKNLVFPTAFIASIIITEKKFRKFQESYKPST